MISQLAIYGVRPYTLFARISVFIATTTSELLKKVHSTVVKLHPMKLEIAEV